MHEFSLCEGILTQVKKANQGKLDNVLAINLVVGKLAGVDLSSLLFWFPVVAKKMNCLAVELKVEEPDGVAICNNCQNKFTLEQLYAACPLCNIFGDFTICSGRELLVKSFEIN